MAGLHCVRAFWVAGLQTSSSRKTLTTPMPQHSTHCRLAFAGPHLNDAVICSSSHLISAQLESVSSNDCRDRRSQKASKALPVILT